MTQHHGVVHFEIPGSDPDKLSDFYRQLFGWTIEKMEMDGSEYWFVMTVPVGEDQMPSERGVINGGLYRRTDQNQRPTNYVNVDSVDQYLEKAKGLGAQVIIEKGPVPGMGWFALIVDPDGNPCGLWQHDPSAA